MSKRMCLLFTVAFTAILFVQCDPCCPDITSFTASPPQICDDPGMDDVTLSFRIVFRKAGSPCSSDELVRLTYTDGTNVPQLPALHWNDDRTELTGEVSGVRVDRARNSFYLIISGDDRCPAYDGTHHGDRATLTVPLVGCSGPGDDVDPR